MFVHGRMLALPADSNLECEPGDATRRRGVAWFTLGPEGVGLRR